MAIQIKQDTSKADLERVEQAMQFIDSGLFSGKFDTEVLIGMFGLIRRMLSKDLHTLFSYAAPGSIDLCYDLFELWYSAVLNRKFNVTLENIQELLELRPFYLKCAVVGRRDAKINISFISTTDKLIKKFLIHRIRDLDEKDLNSILKCDTAMKSYLSLAALDVTTPNEDEEYARELVHRKIKFNHLPHNKRTAYKMATAYMHCSYEPFPECEKSLKTKINGWFKQGHKMNKVKVKDVSLDTDKPVVAVVVDRMTSKHAMFRWYKPMLEALQDEFYTVLVSVKSNVDENVLNLFDEFIDCSEHIENLQGVLDRVKPDVVYYPSIGMSPWSVSLSNIRWADRQVISFGHPSEPFSNCIDGVFVKEETNLDVTLATQLETINTGKSTIEEVILHEDTIFPEIKEINTEECYIAIPCNHIKITGEFIATLKRIQEESDKEIHYVFFPNVSGINLQALKMELCYDLKNVTVIPPSKYGIYLERLASCHFAVSTFPFGSASGVVDCVCAGIPIVSIDGDRVCGLTDKMTYYYLDGGVSLVAGVTGFRDVVKSFVERGESFQVAQQQTRRIREKLMAERGTPDMSKFLESFKVEG